MSAQDTNGKDQGTSVEVLEAQVREWRDADDRWRERFEAEMRDREDSNEGFRRDLESHRREDAAALATLTTELKGLRESVDSLPRTMWRVVGMVLAIATLGVGVLELVLKR